MVKQDNNVPEDEYVKPKIIDMGSLSAAYGQSCSGGLTVNDGTCALNGIDAASCVDGDNPGCFAGSADFG